jgi:hypothetical protein
LLWSHYTLINPKWNLQQVSILIFFSFIAFNWKSTSCNRFYSFHSFGSCSSRSCLVCVNYLWTKH